MKNNISIDHRFDMSNVISLHTMYEEFFTTLYAGDKLEKKQLLKRFGPGIAEIRSKLNYLFLTLAKTIFAETFQSTYIFDNYFNDSVVKNEVKEQQDLFAQKYIEALVGNRQKHSSVFNTIEDKEIKFKDKLEKRIIHICSHMQLDKFESDLITLLHEILAELTNKKLNKQLGGFAIGDVNTFSDLMEDWSKRLLKFKQGNQILSFYYDHSESYEKMACAWIVENGISALNENLKEKILKALFNYKSKSSELVQPIIQEELEKLKNVDTIVSQTYFLKTILNHIERIFLISKSAADILIKKEMTEFLKQIVSKAKTIENLSPTEKNNIQALIVNSAQMLMSEKNLINLLPYFKNLLKINTIIKHSTIAEINHLKQHIIRIEQQLLELKSIRKSSAPNVSQANLGLFTSNKIQKTNCSDENNFTTKKNNLIAYLNQLLKIVKANQNLNKNDKNIIIQVILTNAKMLANNEPFDKIVLNLKNLSNQIKYKELITLNDKNDLDTRLNEIDILPQKSSSLRK